MRKIHARVMGGMHLVNLKPNKYVCVAGGGGGGNGEGGSGLGCKCARDFAIVVLLPEPPWRSMDWRGELGCVQVESTLNVTIHS